MKFKPGQLVRKKARKEGIDSPYTTYNAVDTMAIYYVLDTQYPSMLVHCVESLFDFIQGKTNEVAVNDYELILNSR